MRKTKKTAPTRVKPQKSGSTPLKASSLSELRDLQRQASKQASQLTVNTQQDDPSAAHGTPGAHAAGPPPKTRRRPHRFLPPGSGSQRRSQVPRSAPEAAAMHTDDVVSPSDTAAEPPSPAPAPYRPATTTTGAPEGILTEDDVALFRRVVQSVTPSTKPSDRVLLSPVPPATPAQLEQRRQHAMGQRITTALEVSDHYASVAIDRDDTVFLQTGHGPHLIKGLKKGKWPAQASLDLHGSNLDEARERLDRFILSCRDHQIRCVRIVHGKGYGSKGGDPVLKETVRRWLSQIAVVQAYIECDEANGGAGAVLVLLSKPTSEKPA